MNDDASKPNRPPAASLPPEVIKALTCTCDDQGGPCPRCVADLDAAPRSDDQTARSYRFRNQDGPKPTRAQTVVIPLEVAHLALDATRGFIARNAAHMPESAYDRWQTNLAAVRKAIHDAEQ